MLYENKCADSMEVVTNVQYVPSRSSAYLGDRLFLHLAKMDHESKMDQAY